jgi:hypothetical protein
MTCHLSDSTLAELLLSSECGSRSDWLEIWVDWSQAMLFPR